MADDGHRKLILVVEDDDDLREMEAILLETRDYRVETAREGREALTIIAKELPSVIFLDLKMPGMDGWAFAREFRARYNRLAPIIVVTAATDARARAIEIGAEGFLEKPFEADQLVEAAARHLRAPLKGKSR